MPKKKSKRQERKRQEVDEYDSDNDSDQSDFEVGSDPGVEIDDGNNFYEKVSEELERLGTKRSSAKTSAMTKLGSFLSLRYLHDFVFDHKDTFAYHLNSIIKKGGGKEVSLACRLVSLIVLTLGELSHDYLEFVGMLETYIKSGNKSNESRIEAIEALCTICFVIGDENLTKTCLGLFQKGFRLNEEGPLLAASMRAWCTIATTTLNDTRYYKDEIRQFPNCIPRLVKLLDHDELQVRATAGESLAVLYTITNSVDPSFFSESLDSLKSPSSPSSSTSASSSSSNSKSAADFVDLDIKNSLLDADIDIDPEAPFDDHLEDLIERFEELVADNNRRVAKAVRKEQRKTFRDIEKTFKEGEDPVESFKIGKSSYELVGWMKVEQYRMFKRILGSGTPIHLKTNSLLSAVLDIDIEADDEMSSSQMTRRAKQGHFKLLERQHSDHKRDGRKKKAAMRLTDDDY